MKHRGLKRSLRDFKKHPWLHGISILTITVSLLILGAFLLCYRNFEYLAEKTSPQVTGTAYLKDGLAEVEIILLKERILSLPNVQRVDFKSKDSVLQELQQFLGTSETEEMPGSELFPNVIELQLRPETSAAEITSLISKVSENPEIIEVDFSEDWLAQYKRVRSSLNLIGVVLMVAVLVGCSLITANFMGMRHQSKREEIDIVTLIGAPRKFVLAPFLWDGLIEGILGSGIALSLLYTLTLMISALLTSQWSSLIGLDRWMFLSPVQFASVLLMGILMAGLGSLTVFLRFQERAAR